MKNWNDITIPPIERKRLILEWAEKKGIPRNKALNIANKKLQITANNAYLNELFDDIEGEISHIKTDDYTEYWNLYDVNNDIKKRLIKLINELKEYLEAEE